MKQLKLAMVLLALLLGGCQSASKVGEETGEVISSVPVQEDTLETESNVKAIVRKTDAEVVSMIDDELIANLQRYVGEKTGDATYVDRCGGGESFSYQEIKETAVANCYIRDKDAELRLLFSVQNDSWDEITFIASDGMDQIFDDLKYDNHPQNEAIVEFILDELYEGVTPEEKEGILALYREYTDYYYLIEHDPELEPKIAQQVGAFWVVIKQDRGRNDCFWFYIIPKD